MTTTLLMSLISAWSACASGTTMAPRRVTIYEGDCHSLAGDSKVAPRLTVKFGAREVVLEGKLGSPPLQCTLGKAILRDLKVMGTYGCWQEGGTFVLSDHVFDAKMLDTSRVAGAPDCTLSVSDPDGSAWKHIRCDDARATVQRVKALPPYDIVFDASGAASIQKRGAMEFDGVRRAVVTLPEAPRGAVRCAFTDSTGQSVPVTWERGEETTLSKTVVLRNGRGSGRWSFSCVAAAVQLPLKINVESQNIAWVFDNRRFDFSGAEGSLPVTLAPNPTEPSRTQETAVRVRLLDLLPLREVATQLSSANGGSSSSRSFSVGLPPAVAEGLSLLAEIALERAKNGGLRVIQRTLRTVLCDRLSRTESQLRAIDEKFVEPWQRYSRRHEPDQKSNRYLLLPATCAAIDHLQLEDLVAQGRLLVAAVQSDAIAFAYHFVDAKLLTLPTTGTVDTQFVVALARVALEHIHVVLQDLIQDRNADVDAQAHALIAGLAAKAGDLLGAKQTPGRCAVALTFTAMSICHATEACDARMIQDILSNPDNYVDYSTCDAHLPSVFSTTYGTQLIGVVTDGLEVVRMASNNARGLERWRAGLRFGSRLLELASDSLGSKDIPKQVVTAFFRASSAALDGDALGALTAALVLLESIPRTDDYELPKGIRRATTMLGAIVGYGKTFAAPEPKDEEAAAKQREQRREVLESAIDALTDRTNREGDWVVSLGTNVGFASGLRNVTGKSFEVAYSPPQLMLPLGFAMQYLPTEDCIVGFHTMLYPLDLGQFLAYGAEVDAPGKENDELAPSWNAFLSPGAQVAMLIGSPSDVISLGLEVSYAPNIDADNTASRGVLRYGAFVAYYVPFIDFN